MSLLSVSLFASADVEMLHRDIARDAAGRLAVDRQQAVTRPTFRSRRLTPTFMASAGLW
jgi:hypothetical protein